MLSGCSTERSFPPFRVPACSTLAAIAATQPPCSLVEHLKTTIANKPERSEVETTLERVRFEELIAEITSDFVRISEDDLEEATRDALRRIGEFMEVDRVVLFELNSDPSMLRCESAWSAAGIKSTDAILQDESLLKSRWLLPKLATGELLAVSHVSDLPNTAASEREHLMRSGVQAAIWIPLHFCGRFVGTLCLASLRDSRIWSEQQISRLIVAANIIANARERFRSERELRKTRQFVEGVTAASPHICFVFDIDSRRTLYINTKTYDEMGLSPEQIVEMGDQILPRFVHPDDMIRFSSLVEDWRSAGDDELIQYKYRTRRNDGDEWRWSNAWLKPFHRAPDGHVDQVIGWSEDFTDRQRAEEDLQRLRDELAHVDRVNTLGEMAAGIAHEISQPLYSITNFLNAAKNVIEQHKQSDLEEVRSWLQQATNAARNAGEIIQRLRTFARTHRHQRQKEHIASLVTEAITFMEFEMRRRETRVVLEFHGENVTLMVDRVQILQVLVNLLQNACEAMVTRKPRERIVTVHVVSDSEKVAIQVRDRGVGLPANEHDIFNPFVTTKSEGLGLGLAISKAIVERHGGQLLAERNPDVGATFHVVIPLSTEFENYE